MLRWVAVVAALLLLGACARLDDSLRAGPSTGPSPAGEERELGSEYESPPAVTVRYAGGSFELEAWSYCYLNACVDGAPREPLPDVGDPSEVIVEFSLEGWTFGATFTPAGKRCGREQAVDLEPRADGTFLLRPAGFADTYDVTLTGQGVGDLAVSFRWTTPADGPLAEPDARLAVLADHDGGVDSYGVELMLTNLAATPGEASATITVREAGGGAVTFDATRAKESCWPVGTVYWDGPDERGLAAADLGPGPFTYEVDLVLDGVAYTATATWPEDEIPGNEPSVALEFSPPLPALT